MCTDNKRGGVGSNRSQFTQPSESPKNIHSLFSAADEKGIGVSKSDTKIFSVHLDPNQQDRVKYTMEMLGTDNKSDAIRWLIDAGWNAKADDIKNIAQLRRNITPLSNE